MSFLLHIRKNNVKSSSIDLEALNSRLCPYHLNTLVTALNSRTELYWNSFSSLKNGLFKTPADHQCEVNSAWAELQYSDSKLSLKTDPMGQCPLWIHETKNSIFISPEQKTFSAIQGFSYEFKPQSFYLKISQRKNNESDFMNIQKINPGASLKFTLSPDSVKAQHHENLLPWHNFQIKTDISLTEAQDTLAHALITSNKSISLENSCSFLSGGIDSSVATVLGKTYSGLKRTYNLKTSLGSEQKESEETSAYLQLPSVTVSLNESKIQTYFENVCYWNEVYDGLTAEILIQLDALLSEIPKSETHIFSGYGADLIFDGMLAHKEYLAVTGVSDTASLLDRAYWSKELSPFYYWARGKRLFHSYWNVDVIKAALQIPLSLQEQQNAQKFVLRSMAVKNNWLTEPLAFRKKLGMTNGTNMNVLFSKHLKLKTDYSFDEKTALSFELFKKLFKSTFDK